MPVVLAIIILLAWVVILGPSLIKRRSRISDGVHSISHFHEQLKVLEHSAPEPIVTPAYRLHTVDSAGAPAIHYPGADTPPVLTVVGAKQLPRPALAFLGDAAPEPERDAAVPHPSARGVRADDLADPPDSTPRQDRALSDVPPRLPDLYARQMARRRRRDTLAVLCALVLVSFAIGFVPGAGSAWIVTGLSSTAMAVYVTLLVRLRQQAEERERKLRYLSPREDQDVLVGVPARGAAGRYAHPSSGRAAAH
jgi:hypothetical protein